MDGRGIFPGRELVRKEWGEVRQGEFVRHFGVTKYAITCYPWTLVKGEFFPGMEFVRGGRPGEV